MANKLEPYHEVKLSAATFLIYNHHGLSLDSFLDDDVITRKLTPEKARELRSIIDLYLYSLYVKEANI